MNGDVDVGAAGRHRRRRCGSTPATATSTPTSHIEMMPTAMQSTVEDNRSKGGKYRIKMEKAMIGKINGGGVEYPRRRLNGDIHLRRYRRAARRRSGIEEQNTPGGREYGWPARLGSAVRKAGRWHNAAIMPSLQRLLLVVGVLAASGPLLTASNPSHYINRDTRTNITPLAANGGAVAVELQPLAAQVSRLVEAARLHRRPLAAARSSGAGRRGARSRERAGARRARPRTRARGRDRRDARRCSIATRCSTSTSIPRAASR